MTPAKTIGPGERLGRLAAHLRPVACSRASAAPADAGAPPQPTLITYANPLLEVHRSHNVAGWLLPGLRRRAFHTPNFGHQGLTMRASAVMALTEAYDKRIPALPSVREACGSPSFSALVVLRGQEVVFEEYAADFGRDMPHSMQSITKSALNLIVGRLVDQGHIRLDMRVGDVLPEVGSGYRDATLQQVLNMTVRNNFIEGYEGNAFEPAPAPGEPMGYSRQEISLGWRLPPAGERRPSMREYICQIGSSGTGERGFQYKSPNNDLLGWIAERASGRSLRSLLQEVMEAAGIEGAFHCSCDTDFVPVTSGGGFMTARDLCRYGQLFARSGRGVGGEAVGSAAFLAATRRRPHGRGAPPIWYRNQMLTDGRWLGHSGFGGQWLAAEPESGCSLALFSVFTPEQEGRDPKEETLALARLTNEILAVFRTSGI